MHYVKHFFIVLILFYSIRISPITLDLNYINDSTPDELSRILNVNITKGSSVKFVSADVEKKAAQELGMSVDDLKLWIKTKKKPEVGVRGSEIQSTPVQLKPQPEMQSKPQPEIQPKSVGTQPTSVTQPKPEEQQAKLVQTQEKKPLNITVEKTPQAEFILLIGNDTVTVSHNYYLSKKKDILPNLLDLYGSYSDKKIIFENIEDRKDVMLKIDKEKKLILATSGSKIERAFSLDDLNNLSTWIETPQLQQAKLVQTQEKKPLNITVEKTPQAEFILLIGNDTVTVSHNYYLSKKKDILPNLLDLYGSYSDKKIIFENIEDRKDVMLKIDKEKKLILATFGSKIERAFSLDDLNNLSTWIEAPQSQQEQGKEQKTEFVDRKNAQEGKLVAVRSQLPSKILISSKPLNITLTMVDNLKKEKEKLATQDDLDLFKTTIEGAKELLALGDGGAVNTGNLLKEAIDDAQKAVESFELKLNAGKQPAQTGGQSGKTPPPPPLGGPMTGKPPVDAGAAKGKLVAVRSQLPSKILISSKPLNITLTMVDNLKKEKEKLATQDDLDLFKTTIEGAKELLALGDGGAVNTGNLLKEAIDDAQKAVESFELKLNAGKQPAQTGGQPGKTPPPPPLGGPMTGKPLAIPAKTEQETEQEKKQEKEIEDEIATIKKYVAKWDEVYKENATVVRLEEYNTGNNNRFAEEIAKVPNNDFIVQYGFLQPVEKQENEGVVVINDRIVKNFLEAKKRIEAVNAIVTDGKKLSNKNLEELKVISSAIKNSVPKLFDTVDEAIALDKKEKKQVAEFNLQGERKAAAIEHKKEKLVDFFKTHTKEEEEYKKDTGRNEDLVLYNGRYPSSDADKLIWRFDENSDKWQTPEEENEWSSDEEDEE